MIRMSNSQDNDIVRLVAILEARNELNEKIIENQENLISNMELLINVYEQILKAKNIAIDVLVDTLKESENES